jgi:hypothetical protein
LYRDSLSYYQVLYSGRDAEIDVAAGGRSSPDVRIEYYHFGGTLLFPQPRGYIGFFSATIGVTRFDARSSGYDSDNEFSGSLGGGVRFPFLRPDPWHFRRAELRYICGPGYRTGVRQRRRRDLPDQVDRATVLGNRGLCRPDVPVLAARRA